VTFVSKCLARLVVAFDSSIRAALLGLCVVEKEWRCLGIVGAALWVVCTAAASWTVGWVVLWIPHFMTMAGRPEHVVLVVKDVLLADMLAGKLGVALAQGAVACVGVILADGIAILVSVFVLDKLANAHFTKFHSGAFHTVFVGFANRVESVDWWTVTWIGHWSVT
jgi:hypothetical protein